jgi:LuxR family maltose regulon positive regulatory protein
MSNLLLTKLHPPALPPARVPRPHLIEHLNDGLQSGRQITLVSAPAGFGKSTCVSEWVGSLETPFTWLSLDPADDDPGRFFAYFIAALRVVNGSLGQETEALLKSGQVPSSEFISFTLINEILEWGTPFVLVLDDLHVIQDPIILQVLENLVSNPPPKLHLVMLSRDDPPLPIARLRAKNQLTEIRVRELRFSLEETAEFLKRMGGIELSKEDVEALEERTEGWVASLQLAMLAIKGRGDVSAFLKAFTGSHVYVADYLVEEVLNRQTEDMQTFLMKTSILERMNAGLCEAVTGEAECEAVLERLVQRNMFVIPLDDERRWFRYHHLFADLLQSNLRKALPAEEIDELHAKAMAWFEQNDFLIEAVHHALVAKEFDRVAPLIDQVAHPIVFAGQVSTLGAWLEALPEETSRAHPRLSFYRLWTNMLQARVDLSDPGIQEKISKLRSLPTSPENDRLRGELMAVACRATILSGRVTEGIHLAQEALAYLGKDDRASRARVYSALSAAYWFEGQEEKAQAAYEECLRDAIAAGDLRLASSTMMVQGLIQREYGRLHEAARTFQAILDLKDRAGVTSAEIKGAHKKFLPAGLGYVGLGNIHLEWNDLETAEGTLKRGIDLCLRGGLDGVFVGGVQMSRLLQAKGDLEGAARELQSLSGISQRVDSFRIPERQIQIHLAKGDIEGASRWAEPLIEIVNRDPARVPLPFLFLEMIQAIVVRVYLAQEEVAKASALLDTIQATAKQGGRLARMIEVHLLRSLASLKQDQVRVTAKAIQSFEHALELAEPEGFTLVFLEEGPALIPLLHAIIDRKTSSKPLEQCARKLLEALRGYGKPGAAPPSGDAPGLVESLTPREMEVLQLIAAGDSNQAIAEKLVITVRTVKKHTSNIYGKLNASSRTQAVALARNLGLLPTD